MLLSRFFVVVLSLLSPAAFADSLNANMNNTSAQFVFNSSASDLLEGNTELLAGVLYNDLGNMFLEAGVLSRGGSTEEGAPGFSVGIGLKGVLGSVQPEVGLVGAQGSSVSAMAVGGEAVFVLPTPTRVAFVGDFFAAPKIMSFGDAQRFNQFSIRVEVEVSPPARVYLGYREIGFGIKNTGFGGSMTLDRGTFVGAMLLF